VHKEKNKYKAGKMVQRLKLTGCSPFYYLTFHLGCWYALSPEQRVLLHRKGGCVDQLLNVNGARSPRDPAPQVVGPIHLAKDKRLQKEGKEEIKNKRSSSRRRGGRDDGAPAHQDAVNACVGKPEGMLAHDSGIERVIQAHKRDTFDTRALQPRLSTCAEMIRGGGKMVCQDQDVLKNI
jgi:hypothetical protein